MPKYKVELEREIRLNEISIAASELNSALHVLAFYRNDEVKFHEHLNYAKELQAGLYAMEVELKRMLRNHVNK